MFDHMLVPLDGSTLAECALPHAVAVARAFGARITLLRVLDRSSEAGSTEFIDPFDWHLGKVEAQAYLDDLTDRLREMGLQAESMIPEGRAAERIIAFVRDHGVDLIVLSSHGRSGLSGWNISGVAVKVILRSYIPTMIVRAYRPAASGLTELRYRRIMVPLDSSRRAERCLPFAATLAQSSNSQVLLAHVVRRPEVPHRAPPTPEDIDLAEQLIERNRLEAAAYLEQLQAQLPLDVQVCLRVGDNVAAELHDLVEQEDIDLVVLNAHGHSGVTKWPYGSVAVSFISYGTAPVLIVQDLSPEELEPTSAEMAIKEYRGH
jgi:nucleotide-binding universal stress UspA family protein